ncbi:MAG: hypothetical protein MUE41_03135 [Gemmatimonadaceae bacterium]|nr:hypothetical protein [Gemmatimonadaceae bacterium]
MQRTRGRRRQRPGLIATTLLLLAGCAREPESKAARVDSVAQPTPPPPPVTIDWRGWDQRAGGLLVVAPEDDPNLAFLVRPDATRAELADSAWRDRIPGDSVVLIGLDGTSAVRALTPLPASATGTSCEEWPAARVADAPPRWGVGFPVGRVRAVPATPVERMSPADSSAAVSVAARIAQATPQARKSGLSGMPFIVERLVRVSLSVATTDSAAQAFGDTTLIAATLFRRLAQEADPREERWFLLAERTGRARNAPWMVRYLEFAEGAEDEADALALLGVVRVEGTGRPAIVLARDGRSGLVLEWIAPTTGGDWRVQWTSARARCRVE